IQPICGRSFQEGHKTTSIKFDRRRNFRADKFGKRWKDINMCSHGRAIMASLEQHRPTPEGGHARAALPRSGFLSMHTRVINLHARRAAIVGHEDDEGISVNSPLV